MRDGIEVQIMTGVPHTPQVEIVSTRSPLDITCPVCRRYLGTALLEPGGWIKVKCQGCNQWRRIERQTA